MTTLIRPQKLEFFIMGTIVTTVTLSVATIDEWSLNLIGRLIQVATTTGFPVVENAS